MIAHLNLSPIKNISDSVSVQEDKTGHPFLCIQHPKLNATFSLHGGHLIHFQAAGKKPIIWLSKTAIYNKEKAIRGGVPICWPWFGAADKALGENLPSHGFARTSLWEVAIVSESEFGVELDLILKPTTQSKALWDHDFELILKASLTSTVALSLVTKNTGDTPFTYKSALHTYLNISAPDHCYVSNLSENSYNDLLNKAESKPGNLKIDQAIDVVYQKSESNINLSDHGFKRVLEIVNQGNDSEVVWTPWIEGASAMADMPDDGYLTMLCIESAITGENGVTVPAKSQHILSTKIVEHDLID